MKPPRLNGMTEFIHPGGCHCGAIRYDFVTSQDLDAVVPRQCGCSFCVRQGARYASDPSGRLEISVKDVTLLGRYRFGHKTADFMFCRSCGVMPVVTCELDGRLYGIVNVNTLDGAERIATPQHLHDYEGEAGTNRLARRKKNWIATVVFIQSDL